MHVAFAVLIFFLWGEGLLWREGHRHFNEKIVLYRFTVLNV